MAFRARRVPVPANTATRLDTGEETDRTAGSSLIVRNRSPYPCELGDIDVTIGTGFEVLPGESLPLETGRDDRGVYVICANNTQIQVLEIGV